MSHTVNGGGNLNSFPDIHAVTDGKLMKYGIRTRYDSEDIYRFITCLIEIVNERANPAVKLYGINGLAIIKNDIKKPPNYQAVDKIYADDILADICIFISRVEDIEVIDTAVNHISEQMSDMINTSGTCPSGRVNRLFQVYMFLRDYLDGKV